MATSAVKKLSKLTTLPQIRKITDSLTVAIRDFDVAYFDQAHKLFVEAAEAGNGFGKNEVERETLFKKLTENRTLLMVEEKTEEMVCVMPFFPSPVCRSTKAALGSGFSIVSPRFTGKGIAKEMYRTAIPQSIITGQIGFNVRANITGRNIVPLLNIGGQITGTIPLSTYIEKVGYADDVLVYLSYNLEDTYPDYFKELVEQRNVELPPLKTHPDILAGLCAWNEYESKDIPTKAGLVQVRSVRDNLELLTAEKLWRSAAEQGVGFGIDEFTEHGHFNRKFFRNPDILIAELASTGEIIGAAMLGASNLSRAEQPVIGQQYMSVKTEHQNKGIARVLLSRSIELLKQQQYKAVISDTFINNYIMIDMLRKHKFVIRGSMPCCSYIKGVGLLDSLIVYKVI